MNFATVELHGDAARVTVTLGGQEFGVPGAVRRHPDLARYLGSRVVIGLRPAAFSVAEAPGEAALTVVPLGVESLGDERHLLFRAPPAGGAVAREGAEDMPVTVDEASGAQLWTAKVTPRSELAIGRPVPLTVDLGAAYFFDPASGEAIAEVPDAVPVAAAA